MDLTDSSRCVIITIGRNKKAKFLFFNKNKHMAHRYSFSSQEKVLAIVAGVLLIVMVIVGYAQATG